MFKKLKEFLKYAPSHQKAIYLTIITCLIIFILYLIYVFPFLNAASVRSGLSIIAGILGVLLGAILLVTERLIDHGQEGINHCRLFYTKYRHLIKKHIDEIDEERKNLIDLIKKGKINADKPVFGGMKGVSPSKTKNRDILGNILILSFIMDRLDIGGLETSLKQIGLNDKEIDKFEFGKAVVGSYKSSAFLKIVNDALYYPFISEWCNNDKLKKLSSKILDDYIHEGIDKALEKIDRSKNILRSKLLGFSIFILSFTTFGSIMFIFNITQNTVSNPIYSYLLIFLLSCFFISLSFTLLLVEKIFIDI